MSLMAKVGLKEVKTMPLPKAMRLAEKASKQGEISYAKDIYQAILARYPSNKKAKKALLYLDAGAVSFKSNKGERLSLNSAITELKQLARSGNYSHCLVRVDEVLSHYPASSDVHNIAGIVQRTCRIISKQSTF